MLCTAIVEDEKAHADILEGHLRRYAAQRELELRVDRFDSGLAFLEHYGGGYDAVFLDILMPEPDGLETARRLREMDEEVDILFVTTMAQYAIRGYEVSAIGFMVKPVKYEDLELKLDKVCRRSARGRNQIYPVSWEGKRRLLPIRAIQYVEVYNHSLVFHTEERSYTVYGQLNALESDPRFSAFAKCSSSCLVNCLWVEEVGTDTVTVGRDVLPLSRRRRKPFLEQMARTIGGGY